MPNGTVMWFDRKTGEGLIRRDGREYPVVATEIEPRARAPHARVHFDVVRQEGVPRAVRVTLRRGGRVSTRQHGFGNLEGAHHPDEKGHRPLTDDHPGLDPAFEGRPLALVVEWSRLVRRGDFPTARLLYAPDALLHVGSDRVRGRDAIVVRLASVLEDFVSAPSEILVEGDFVTIAWPRPRGSRRMRFQIKHGRIAQQWTRARGARPARRRR